MSRTSIDDNNTTLVEYQGSWESLTSSSRQFDSTVHGSTEDGATATFNFRGYQVWVWGTIPPGVGTNSIDISIDGGAPTTTSRTSNGTAVFDEQYFASPTLVETYHTIVVTNRGSTAKGNSEFLLDRFEFESSDVTPVFTPSGVSSTSTPSATSSNSPATASSSGGSKTPWGAIIGVIVAVFLLVIGFLLFLLWRRRRRGSKRSRVEAEKATPVPFPLREAPATSFEMTRSTSARHHSELTNSQPTSPSNQISEKAGYQHLLHLASLSSPTDTHAPSFPPALASSGLVSSTTLGAGGSSHSLVHIRGNFDNPASPSNDSMYVSPINHLRNSTFDNPPPSYYHGGPSTGQ